MISKKAIKKGTLSVIAVLLLVTNIIAFNHAWKFTHYTKNNVTKTKFETLSFWNKVKYGITGVDNPRPKIDKTPNVPYETVMIKSNVQLECWLIQANQPLGTVILFHGYTGDKSKMLERAYKLNSHGYNTMLVDLMGSGGSEGNQVTIGYKEAVNVKDCYEYVKQTGEKHIALYGTSLGAAALMKAIKDYGLQPDCSIIEAPFSTMYQTVCNRFDLVGASYFPMAPLLVFWGGVQNGFWAFSHNPLDYAKSITTPTLLLFGAKDDRVTLAETEDIFNNLAGEKELHIYPNAGHVNYLKAYPEEWASDVNSFLTKHLAN